MRRHLSPLFWVILFVFLASVVVWEIRESRRSRPPLDDEDAVHYFPLMARLIPGADRWIEHYERFAGTDFQREIQREIDRAVAGDPEFQAIFRLPMEDRFEAFAEWLATHLDSLQPYSYYDDVPELRLPLCKHAAGEPSAEVEPVRSILARRDVRLQFLRDIVSGPFAPGLRVYIEAQVFGELESKAASVVGPLVALLGDEDPAVRVAAWHLLITIANEDFGSCETFACCSEALHAERARVVQRWREWWESHRGQDRVAWLLDGIPGPRAQSALWELVDIADDRVIPKAREALADRELRWAATEVLAHVGDRAAVPYIVEQHLCDDDEWDRQRGFDLLKRITSETFGYDPARTAEDQPKAMRRWEEYAERVGTELGVPFSERN